MSLSRPSSGIQSPPNRARSRTQSLSSDRPSTLGHSLMSPPLTVSPEAAFIAASAASQIVTNDHDSHADAWYDQHGIEPSGETALVSPGALQLVNNFLDQLLFNFLSISRSTTLSSLRPAVSEVLKPKLAKDAVNQADEELREYLGGGDDEDLLQQATETPKDWDLELVWKRTRLRCMVYSSLGDMEEEDEDYYMEQEHLDAGEERLSETVSPAVAIFLTSILEFMGEQALVVAGQAAYHRMRSKYEKDLKDGARSPVDIADRIVVEELDMERVALDRTLGRLWRAWKKRIRSPIVDSHSFQRPFSRGSERHRRTNSFGTENQVPVPEKVLEVPAVPASARARSRSAASSKKAASVKSLKKVDPANVALPMGDRDIAEILIPGLAYYSDDEDELMTDKLQRPKSLTMILTPSTVANLLAATATETDEPVLPAFRRRSNSLPAPALSRQPWPPTESPEVVPSEDDFPFKNTKTKRSKSKRKTIGPMSSIAASATAIGTAALAGLASVVTGSALHTNVNGADDAYGEIDEFNEEPEILTSSRVSISGRSSSPTASETGRPLSFQTGLPKRSQSVHSIRVIDMAGPRSPISRSRGSSVEAQDHIPMTRAEKLARTSTSSLSTPPIVEERRMPAAVAKSLRAHAGDSISEAEEAPELSGTPTTESLSTPTSVPGSALRFEDLQTQLQAGSAILGSVPRHGSPPQSPASPTSPVQPTTKVTILSSTHSPPAYYEEEHETQVQVPLKSPTRAKATSPTPPDRSSSRQVNGHSPQAGKSPPIGVITVDRRSLQSEPKSSPGREATVPRPTHTSASSISSSSHKFKMIRASEDSATKRPEDVARNFEELIQSEKTIQYTLTPEGMREDARNADQARSSSMSNPTDLKRSISISRTTGLSSHPVELAPKPKGPPPQARDARVPRESLADFADFIRATGPAEEAAAAALARQAAPGVLRGPIPNSKMAMDPNRQSTIARARYQARDATTDGRDDNADLIDFIRRGPPSAANPRIPRTVAPFRSTMDSDQMSGAIGGKAVDARLPDIRYSGTSTNVTESSFNSSSALLKKDKSSPKFGDESDMMPKRKTRRVKDPYALDFSDDEGEEEEEPAPRRPVRAEPKEESLADFLNSVAPPPETAPVPFNIPQTQNRALPKKKASAPSLMARFASRVGDRSPTATSPTYGRMSPVNAAAAAGPRPAAGRSQSGKGYIPIQVNMPPGTDKYSPGPSNGASSPLGGSGGGGAAGAPKGRVLMKKFEPRDANPTPSRGTSDLADFLRNSGPQGGSSFGARA